MINWSNPVEEQPGSHETKVLPGQGRVLLLLLCYLLRPMIEEQRKENLF